MILLFKPLEIRPPTFLPFLLSSLLKNSERTPSFLHFKYACNGVKVHYCLCNHYCRSQVQEARQGRCQLCSGMWRWINRRAMLRKLQVFYSWSGGVSILRYSRLPTMQLTSCMHRKTSINLPGCHVLMQLHRTCP